MSQIQAGYVKQAFSASYDTVDYMSDAIEYVFAVFMSYTILNRRLGTPHPKP